MMVDPFKNGYSLTQLSLAINILPNMYGKLTQMGLFTYRAQADKSITIEMKNGVLSLVPTGAWGGPSPKNKNGKSSLRSFVVPHTSLEDDFPAIAAQGVRAFGSESVADSIAMKVNESLQNMKNKIDQTMEYRRMGALKGLVLDADGSTVLYNYFDEFGIAKKIVNFNFASAPVVMRDKCMEVARHIEDNLLGEVMQRIEVWASPEFFDAFVNRADVKAAFANYSEAAQRIGGDMRKGFSYGGLTISEYRGSATSSTGSNVKFIEAGKAIAFPVGTFDSFLDFGAPGDFNDTVNTLALPYYAKQKEKDFQRGYDLHVQSNILPMCTRPSLIVELTSA